MDVAFQNTFFDQHVVLTTYPFIINVERAAQIFECTVIDNRTQIGSDFFADFACKYRRAFTVKIAFQAMTHRLMQQHTRPTRTEYHRHGSGRSGYRFKVNERLTNRFIGERKRDFLSRFFL
ncbi:Uncharacterised protein [Vibrio cholerae]|nr:Uncharacterised protein [Vibrio cholerae]CSB69073.1 Uncharacterised protein [Vibrio cholerae]CSB77500.1 Uncharacterised protein [Vibrio cholerae]